MRFLGRNEGLFYAEMQRDLSALKPHTAAFGELGWLWPFVESENATVESASRIFLARRHRKLNVIDGKKRRPLYSLLSFGVWVIVVDHLARAHNAQP